MFGFAKNSYLLSTHCSLESIIIDARNLLRLCGLWENGIKLDKATYRVGDARAGRRGRREIERWA